MANIGYCDDRNSNRILKRQGGGHSQIFGNFEEERNKTSNHSFKHYNSSEITACFTHQTTEKVENRKVENDSSVTDKCESKNGEAIEKNENEEKKAENGETKSQNNENGLTSGAPEEVKSISARQRGRIPPGGFSSGFW